MNPPDFKRFAALMTAIVGAALCLVPCGLQAQVPWWAAVPELIPVPTTPQAQANAVNNVRTRVFWLKNATQTAPNTASGGDQVVWRSFEALCLEYSTFTRTLTPQQKMHGADELAELEAGLGILQEAYANYQQDLGLGRRPSVALRDMCQVLRRGADVWLQEFNQVCARLRVGR